jgi:hypothetical protein
MSGEKRILFERHEVAVELVEILITLDKELVNYVLQLLQRRIDNCRFDWTPTTER